MKNRFRKQNFSLLEMMVVVAVILILCMMLMPAINSVKEVARRSQCLSRVREVAQLQSRFAANNNGQLPLAQYFTPPGETTASQDDFSIQIMKSLIPAAAQRRDEHWWMFACTNVLPYWNAGATMNGGAGYEKGKVNDFLEERWVRIKPENQGREGDIGYLSGPDSQGEIEVTGNFGVNNHGDFPSHSILDGKGSSRTAVFAHMSQVKSPGKRAFIAEEGESVNKDNATHLIEVVEYNKPISRGQRSAGTATGYLPGMGAGGIGREKMESIGFDSTILDELDEERLELVKKDVMEGRHAGTTLHGFFDGHAEVVDATTVGHLQLGPGEGKNDRRGYYGKITDAADDDEE